MGKRKKEEISTWLFRDEFDSISTVQGKKIHEQTFILAAFVSVDLCCVLVTETSPWGSRGGGDAPLNICGLGKFKFRVRKV